MKTSSNMALRLWVATGLVAYVVLPWYAIQDTAWYAVLPQVFGGPETANGLVQALVHGRKWLLLGLAGLVIAAVGVALPPGRQQGRWLLAGGLLGSLGLAVSGFAIGAKGWAFDALNSRFGELAVQQFGIGAGGAFALAVLILLAAFLLLNLLLRVLLSRSIALKNITLHFFNILLETLMALILRLHLRLRMQRH